MRRTAGALTLAVLVILGAVSSPPSATAGHREPPRTEPRDRVARVVAGRSEPSRGGVPYGYATEHRVYVGIVTNRGPFEHTPDQLMAAVDDALAYWRTTVPAGFTALLRVGPVDIATAKTPSVPEGCGAKGGAGFYEMMQKARKLMHVPKRSTPKLVTHVLLLAPEPCGELAGDGGVADLTTGWASGDGSALVPEQADQAFRAALVHELGHTLGLNHAWRECAPGQSCTQAEYGDCYSPMGSGDRTVIGSATRALSGIVEPGEIRAIDGDLGPSETDLVIRPRGETSGVRGVSVLDPESGRIYYFDYRTHTGLDAQRPYPLCPDGITVTERGALRTTFLIPKSSAFTLPPQTSWLPGDVIHVGSLTVTVGDQDPTTGAVLHVSVPNLPPVPQVGVARMGRKVAEGLPARIRVKGPIQPAPIGTFYEWYVDGELVRDHNQEPDASRRITVPVGDAKHLVGELVAVVPGYHRAIMRTAPVRIIQRAIFFRPFIKGDAKVGHTIRAWFDPTWGGPPELSHVHHVCRWYANGKLIQSRPSLRLHLGPELAGKYVVATVSVHGKGYMSETRTSNPTLVEQ